MHHAVAAGDDRHRPQPRAGGGPAGRAAGSHRQALAHYEQVVPHLALLPPEDQARVLVDYAWELYVAQRWNDSVRPAAGR